MDRRICGIDRILARQGGMKISADHVSQKMKRPFQRLIHRQLHLCNCRIGFSRAHAEWSPNNVSQKVKRSFQGLVHGQIHF